MDFSQGNDTHKTGKLIILSGVSGSGKSYIADLLVKHFNYAQIRKYVTRPLRQSEIEQIKQGEIPDVRPVFGEYNDGEKDEEHQKENSELRKRVFQNLKLPISYINYGEYYGFSTDEIDAYLENGRNVVVVANDIGVIRDLETIYGKDCRAYYVHRSTFLSEEEYINMAKKRGDTIEHAKKRYEKSIRDQERFNQHNELFDQSILNTGEGSERLLKLLQQIHGDSPINHQMAEDDKKAKIYVFIGSPGSGKDETLETIKVQGTLHSIIMPKYTDRERRDDDGEEMICQGDPGYDMSLCDIQYKNYGTTYGINTKELLERLQDGISSCLVVSNPDAIEELRKRFPEELVTIYIHGMTKEEYQEKNKDNLEDPYVVRRLKEYDSADKYYLDNWSGFNHTMIFRGDLTDLYTQLSSIIRTHEGSRLLSKERYRKYMNTVRRYLDRLGRNRFGNGPEK